MSLFCFPRVKKGNAMKIQRKTKRYAVLMATCMMAVVIAVSSLAGVFSVPAKAATYQSLSEYFGLSETAILHELQSHRSDSYYLGTPYRDKDDANPAACMSPNGDPNGFGPGMNCTGFIAYVFQKVGADLSAIASYGFPGGVTNATNWYGALVDTGLLDSYEFATVDALLASGMAQKGDIIYCDPLDWGAPGADCHIGFFWGDVSSDNKYWHSGTSPASGNQISEIIPKTVPSKFFLIKTGTKPAMDPIGVLLRKADNDTNGTAAQGNASLQNAQFTVKYYDGLYTESQLSSVNPTRTWIFKTDVDGEIYFDAAYLVSGDPFYYSAGYPSMPEGTVTVQETKAPTGYALNSKLYIQQITANNLGQIIVHYNAPLVPESVIRGGVSVEKWDNELNTKQPQGSSSLENAVLEIYNRNSGSVVVGGKTYASGTVVATITTNASGVAETANNLLPYGDYEVIEKTPPDGYTNTGKLRQTFSISASNVIVRLNTSVTAIKNDPKRGDLEGVKISEGMQRMAYVPFQITSKTTGESHVVVTDENGFFSTSSDWNLHSQDTNRGETEHDGVWFGDIATLDDSKGALLYDTYTLEELPCDTNEGHKLLAPFDVKISRHNTVVKLGTITNYQENEPGIRTTAIDEASGTHRATAGGVTTIIDTVRYVGLTIGEEYTLKGILMDKATGESLLVNGKEVTASAKFTAQKPSGSVDVTFIFDSTGLEGMSTVVFETLYCDGIEIAIHADIMDSGQTVTFKIVPISGMLKIFKLDAGEKTPLAGAEFTVYDENGKVVDTLITDETGWAEITLPGSKYMVKESKAPEGYLLDETGHEFEIDENGIEVPITVLNSRTPEIPPQDNPAKPFPKTGVVTGRAWK